MSGEETERMKKSAASTKTHTRNTQQSSSSGYLKTFLLVSFVGALAWFYQSIQPPPAKIIGPAVISPRIKLRDGRHLAYKELGISRDQAKFKIISIHGFAGCMHNSPFENYISPALVEELKIYVVSFDRPGYGESDPNPKGSMRSISMDIEELADGLGLGPKFYVFGMSMGGIITWSCLNYIPHRLAGAVLVAPGINYWWRNLPREMAREGFSFMYPTDQWALRIAHYAPWLAYWWNTQKWIPSSNIVVGNPIIFSRQDKEILPKLISHHPNAAYTRQQGEYVSLYQDLNIGFSSWEFDPFELQDPFPNNNGSVHIWHGDEDRFVPVKVQRYIASKLPWVRYHEISGSGHLLAYFEGMTDKMIKSLLVGEEDSV